MRAEAGVALVTGDTKVVNRGHGDGVFINTSGVGTLAPGVELGGARRRPGDVVLVTGTLGDHGITIMSCRESLSFSADLESDAAPLNHLIAAVLAAAPNTRCFRDPTRGGLASTLNELAAQSQTDIVIEEDAVPVKPAVLGRARCWATTCCRLRTRARWCASCRRTRPMRRCPPCGPSATAPTRPSSARCRRPSPRRGSKVFLRTAFGGTRILDMLVGEQLPRIC